VQTAVVIAVAAAGALGASSRYVLSIWLRDVVGESPFPIALINITGCFGFGLCWALASGRMTHPVAVAILAGFFGAFTTFSAFALDGQLLLAERKFALFSLNVLLQNGVGMLFLWLGMLLGGARS
jgi:fluoride exporter